MVSGEMKSVCPAGRKMHGAACLAPYAPLLVVYGGWELGALPDVRAHSMPKVLTSAICGPLPLVLVMRMSRPGL